MGSTLFFETQLDFIFFFYGLAFILMAQACFTMRHRDKQPLPWVWLGLFGAVHGLHEWLELLANSFGDTGYLSAVRTCLMVASFTFLAEFGRSGTRVARGKGVGSWVFFPILGLAASGGFAGWPGLGASSRYSLGLVGGLWAGSALLMTARGLPGASRTRLTAAGWAMMLYALATGLVVPYAPFFPASVVNNAAFFKAAGFPVQLLRGTLAVVAAASMMSYSKAVSLHEAGPSASRERPIGAFWPVFSILMVLLLGWYGTNMFARYEGEQARIGVLGRALTAASSLEPYAVKALVDSKDSDGPEFMRIHRQLQSITAVNPDCRSAYIGYEKDGVLVYISGGTPSGPVVRPGAVYSEALKGGHRDSQGVRPEVFGPYNDQWGVWAVVSTPILDPDTGSVMARFLMAVDAFDWTRSVALERLYIIILTLIFCILVMVVFSAWQRNRESAAQSLSLKTAAIRLNDEKKLRDITSALGEGVYVLDRQGRLIFMNPEAERLLGYSEAELLGKDLHGVIHCNSARGDFATTEGCPVLHTLQTGHVNRVEDDSFTRKDGSPMPVAYVTTPIREDGAIVGAVTAFRDITVRKASEEKLRLLSEAVEAAQDGVQIVDMGGRIIYSNQAVREIYGFSPEEYEGKHVSDMNVDPEAAVRDILPGIMKNGRWSGELLVKHKDGSAFPILLSSSLVKNRRGEPIAMVGIVRDISRQKALDQQKNDFYAMVTHDLKSPLTAVLGYTEIMLTSYSDRIDADVHDMVRGIENSSRRLLHLVENFLTMSRLEPGNIALRLSDEDVVSLLAETGYDANIVALKKGVGFKYDLPQELPHAMLDRNYAQRAIANLLQNAVAYTPAGGEVTLSVRHEPGNGSDTIVISVTDSGPGIPVPEQEKIFDKYYRSPRDMGIKGTGLGLAIVKAVAVAHGGRVELLSPEGGGSTFKLVLPVRSVYAPKV